MQIEARIARSEEVDADFARQVSHLTSQLRGEPIVVTETWLQELLVFPRTWMIIVEAEGKIAAMLTLSAFPRARGWTAWIEGVVVEETLRGRGIGRTLLQKAVSLAAEQGFETINLSSRPHREIANALYQSLGFEIVTTNYRRLVIAPLEKR